MTISALPTPPTRSDPTNFASRADAFLAALPTFQTEANALAVAMNLNATTDTSATSVTIGTGAKSFTVSAGKSFQAGMYLVIADTAAPSTNSMWGQVTSYAGTALVMNIISVLGSGTKTAWTISQSAPNAEFAYATNNAAGKTTPVDADVMPIIDSAAGNTLKKLSWANLKATLASWIASSSIAGAFTTLSATGSGTFGTYATIGGSGETFYADINNTAIRAKSSGGGIYFQNNTGGINWGSWASTGLSVIGGVDVYTATGSTSNWSVFRTNCGAAMPTAPLSGVMIGGNYSGGTGGFSEANIVWNAGVGSSQYLAIGKNVTGTYTEQLRVDYNGILGLSVIPYAWSAGKAIQFGSYGTIYYDSGTGYTHFGSNFYNNAGYKYGASDMSSRYSQGAGNHLWFSAPSGTAGNAITYTQVMGIGKGITLALEGGTSTAGTGIAFPATQLASSDANTLDDYEEGTFTPTIAGSTTTGVGTYGVQTGNYTKIGNMVSVRIYLQWSAHTGTGNISIAGLPFTCSQYAAASAWVSNLTLTAGNTFQAYIGNGGTSVSTEQAPSGGGTSAAIPMDTSGQIMIVTTYQV